MRFERRLVGGGVVAAGGGDIGGLVIVLSSVSGRGSRIPGSRSARGTTPGGDSSLFLAARGTVGRRLFWSSLVLRSRLGFLAIIGFQVGIDVPGAIRAIAVVVVVIIVVVVVLTPHLASHIPHDSVIRDSAHPESGGDEVLDCRTELVAGVVSLAVGLGTTHTSGDLRQLGDLAGEGRVLGVAVGHDRGKGWGNGE